MPWQTNADLPDHVRGVLPAAAQTRFRQVANKVIYGDKGSEESAFKQAWHVVKQGWEKGEGGQWVRKVVVDLKKATPRTLYVCRYVQNGADIVKWAKAQGFQTTVPADDMHVTVAFSRAPVDWIKVGEGYPSSGGDSDGILKVRPGGPRLVEKLGEAVVLLFANNDLAYRHQGILDAGASWDHLGYQPHVTISWKADGLDLSKIEPYSGEIVLGPEVFKEVNEDWKSTVVEKMVHDRAEDVRVIKVDKSLGLVFGYAIICKKDGQDYYDLNKDDNGERVPEHIPEHSMLEAATDFMLNSRIAKEMHVGDGKGSVVFAFPLTTDIAKSLGIETKTTGLLIAMKPNAEMLQKFINKELTGFSIGGSKLKSREEEYAA